MGLRAEAWVGEWFRNLGYEVHITAFQGDHGVDLILSTVGEASPAGSVGAMHHQRVDVGQSRPAHASSIAPSDLKGVTSATPTPRNCLVFFMTSPAHRI